MAVRVPARAIAHFGPRRAWGLAGGRVAARAGPDGQRPELVAADERPPAGVRLLRGDRATLLTLVGILAGDAASEQRHWQLLLTDLVDGIMARAIEAGRLDYS
jgi:hypothetical protein